MKTWRSAGVVAIALLAPAVLAGCPNKSEVSGSLWSGGMLRTYRLHVPPSYSPSKFTPLIVAMHPWLMTGEAMEQMTGFNALAYRERFLVAYPDGIGQQWSTPGIPMGGGVDDIGFIAALLNKLESEYAVDTKRIYVTGASNGGTIAYWLPYAMPGRFAAIAPVMTTLPMGVAQLGCPTIPVPVLAIHGVADPVIPWNGGTVSFNGRQAEFLSALDSAWVWSQNNECVMPPLREQLPNANPLDGTTVFRIAYPAGPTGAEVILYGIEGGGHTWPGSPVFPEWPKWTMGKTCRDINASEVIWSFFKEHALP